MKQPDEWRSPRKPANASAPSNPSSPSNSPNNLSTPPKPAQRLIPLRGRERASHSHRRTSRTSPGSHASNQGNLRSASPITHGWRGSSASPSASPFASPFASRSAARADRRQASTLTLAQVFALPRYGVVRMGLRWRQASMRVKLGLLLALTFISVVLLPAAFAYTLNRGNYVLLPSPVTTMDATDTIRVYRTVQGDVVRVPLNNYLENVLAAEVDPNAPFAALQAAAVAARTYAIRATVHQLFATPTFAQAHGADVTDNGSLDLPWLTASEQRTRFQAQASADEVRYAEAITSTNGQVLTYQGQPILAFAFQLSPGKTRNGSQVFGVSLPYLSVVACPDDARVGKVSQVVQIPAAKLTRALGLPNGVNLSQLQIGVRDAEGFVTSVSAGSKSWSGPEFAARLNLPSSNFTIQLNSAAGASAKSGSASASGSPGSQLGSVSSAAGITVYTRGVGLDLGMSLHEAAVMATQGTAWQTILSHFYPGTTLQADTKWTK